MLAKTLIFATLAALAVAAPAPYGRNRQGGHRNHKWGNKGKWNNNDDSSASNSNDSNDDSSSNDWSESETTSADKAQKTDSEESQKTGQVDSGSAVTGGFSAVASYYDITNPSENEGESAGSVACSGAKYANGDAIVAIASQQYDGGSVCGKRVRITDTKTGGTAEATIVDECMSCSDHQLDLTPSLWSQLHGQSTDTDNNDGVFDIKWEFI